MSDFTIAASSTALVMIDLQHGIVALPTTPYASADIVSRCATLAQAFRAKGGTVVYVRVDIGDMQHHVTDAGGHDPDAPKPPAIASEIVPESGFQAGDLLITKRQWGAFYDTGLDQQLRRRGIKTIVMAGIATNVGVESTARAAFDCGYDLVFAEDAMSSLGEGAHGFAVQNIFPRMGRVRSAATVAAALA
jgi:nicotinamidase-related amidase